MLCMIRCGFQRRATTAVAALSPAQACSRAPNMSSRHEQVHLTGVFSPEMFVLIQKRHPYPEHLNSEPSGDSRNAFLHCGDVLNDMLPTHKHHISCHHFHSCKTLLFPCCIGPALFESAPKIINISPKSARISPKSAMISLLTRCCMVQVNNLMPARLFGGITALSPSMSR